MMENFVIAGLFVGALTYIGNMVRVNFASKTGCAKGCGSCGAIDFQKIEARMREKEEKIQPNAVLPH
jgi:hypothetical protein